MRVSSIVGSLVAVVVGAGCTVGTETLRDEGPPEILQVLVRERVVVEGDEGDSHVELGSRLAHGDHADIDPDLDDRAVDAAVARGGQRIRIVLDELLRGNRLEEIPCADGSWSRVPDGTGVDDIAACAGADLGRCDGVCVGAAGPVGIRDDNGDGAIDDTRLIDGMVTLRCGDEVVALDVERSYYQPSGSQLISTGSLGTDALGPAVVLVPAVGLRPGARCGLAFAGDVVDKQDQPVAGAADVAFTVEPFLLIDSHPAAGAADVALTDPDSPDATITLALNATLDAATLAGAVTVTADGALVAGATLQVAPDDDATVLITVPGGFTAGAAYQVTVAGGAAGLADAYADTLADDAVIAFATETP